jgi:hypothetical protein
VSQKEAKKNLKYTGLRIEIQQSRNGWGGLIQVITETTITILKLFTKYHSKIPGKHIKELQKTTLLGTAHILQRV